MKRLLTLLLSLALIFSLSVTAFADVIYEPEDPFLLDHIDQCERIDRSYRALTEVTVYKSPENDMIVDTLVQGTHIYIYYSYTDSRSNVWGYCENYEDDWSGWLPLAYMELVYDYISFNEDYGHTFLDEDGQLSEDYITEKVWFWNYPGSESGYEFDMAMWSAEYLPEYDTVYQDEQGRSWGYVGYYYGNRHFWICLDDPTADFAALYPDGTPSVDVTQPGETDPTLPAREIVPQPSSGTTLLRAGVTLAVVACIVVTVILLVKMKKKGE